MAKVAVWVNKMILKIRKFLRNESLYNFVLYGGFAYFIIIMFWIILLKAGHAEWVNELFSGRLSNMTLKERFNYGFESLFLLGERPSNKAIRDFLLNVLVFTPFGLYLPLIHKKPKFFKFLFIAIFTTVFCECFQLVTIFGRFNVDDLIANTLGYIVGFIVYLTVIKKLKYYHIATINLLVVLITTHIFIYAVRDFCNDLPIYQSMIELLLLKYQLFIA